MSVIVVKLCLKKLHKKLFTTYNLMKEIIGFLKRRELKLINRLQILFCSIGVCLMPIESITEQLFGMH